MKIGKNCQQSHVGPLPIKAWLASGIRSSAYTSFLTHVQCCGKIKFESLNLNSKEKSCLLVLGSRKRNSCLMLEANRTARVNTSNMVAYSFLAPAYMVLSPAVLHVTENKLSNKRINNSLLTPALRKYLVTVSKTYRL